METASPGRRPILTAQCDYAGQVTDVRNRVVMPGVIPVIHVFAVSTKQDVDGRDKARL